MFDDDEWKDWSWNYIASYCGLSDKTVKKLWRGKVPVFGSSEDEKLHSRRQDSADRYDQYRQEQSETGTYCTSYYGARVSNSGVG
ncbi:MAG: hypothetical protein IPG58_19825 [Acidobacteria bacterium]|nr:hypothetical protein [Acidobacteriota bacterium]